MYQSTSTPGTFKAVEPQGKKNRGIDPVVFALIIPLGVFAAVYADRTFAMRCDRPGLSAALLVLFALVVLVTIVLGVESTFRFLKGQSFNSPAWHLFLAVTSLLAFAAGTMVGDANFYSNTRPWCDLTKLSVYPAVDPATSGKQLMDAGRVQFTPGSKLDLDKGMAFKNRDQYCVAPIVGPSGMGAEVDFWAVGLNCCSGLATDFHCGEYDSKSAHSGLRLVREDQRAFYRLAVEQAEAAFGVKSPHPLFFYWLTDYDAELDTYQDDALKFFGLGVACFFVVQVVLVLVAQVTFHSLGLA